VAVGTAPSTDLTNYLSVLSNPEFWNLDPPLPLSAHSPYIQILVMPLVQLAYITLRRRLWY